MKIIPAQVDHSCCNTDCGKDGKPGHGTVGTFGARAGHASYTGIIDTRDPKKSTTKQSVASASVCYSSASTSASTSSAATVWNKLKNSLGTRYIVEPGLQFRVGEVRYTLYSLVVYTVVRFSLVQKGSKHLFPVSVSL